AGDPATGEPIGKTEKNLMASVAGETYEYTQMYPGMAKIARDEGLAELAERLPTPAQGAQVARGAIQQGPDADRGQGAGGGHLIPGARGAAGPGGPAAPTPRWPSM